VELKDEIDEEWGQGEDDEEVGVFPSLSSFCMKFLDEGFGGRTSRRWGFQRSLRWTCCVELCGGENREDAKDRSLVRL
jgi:hypothetical protein